MPTRKIADLPGWPHGRCYDREHNPPNMIVLPPGVYEHECPTCHRKQRFVVPAPPTLGSPKRDDTACTLDAIGPAYSPTHVAGKVTFPLRVYDHRSEPVGWTTERPEWCDP